MILQVAYMLESGVSDRLPVATVKKITSVLKKMGIYRDPNMFYRLENLILDCKTLYFFLEA